MCAIHIIPLIMSLHRYTGNKITSEINISKCIICVGSFVL